MLVAALGLVPVAVAAGAALIWADRVADERGQGHARRRPRPALQRPGRTCWQVAVAKLRIAARWGVVFRDLVARENIAVPWREVLRAFRRMEARGTVSGGRFVNGFSGEQFAHPDAVALLREIRKRPRDGETVRLSAADPLNLVGIVLPGPRIPAVATNSVSYTDGAVAVAASVPSLTA